MFLKEAGIPRIVSYIWRFVISYVVPTSVNVPLRAD